MEKNQAPVEEPEASVDAEVPTQISLFRHPEIPAYLRFGLPLYLVGAFALLLVSDLGSGISADYIFYRPDGSIFDEKTLLTASIFSSVSELWHNGSYPLAILIAITSIGWPYVKLCANMFAWMVPSHSLQRREHFLEIFDVLGKWSFVDVFVLLIIMVAFRATMNLGGNILEIMIVPKWGFYGFVCATILSLLATHVIIYHHRRIRYKGSAEKAGSELETGTLIRNSGLPKIGVALFLAASVALQIAGVLLDIFKVTSERGQIVTEASYSFISVGLEVPDAVIGGRSDAGVRWIQAIWFLLAVALPLLQPLIWGTLYFVPLSKERQRQVFFLAEIVFSWSCIDVLIVSSVFSVLQIPTFGDGLVRSNCDLCFEVSSEILPTFAVPVLSCFCQVLGSCFLYRKAHRAVYDDQSEEDE